MNVLVLYYSRTGHTLEAAEAVAEGIRSVGSVADLIEAQAFDAGQLDECDGLIVASPCWAGSAGRPMLPKPMSRALEAMGAETLAANRCGAISVYAAAGGEGTVQHLGELLASKGCSDMRAGPVAKAGVPLSLWKGPSVTQEDEARFREYGATFVEG